MKSNVEEFYTLQFLLKLDNDNWHITYIPKNISNVTC
jgi:hypothetical protein